MNNRLKILQAAITAITEIEICGERFPLNWESEAVIETEALSIHKPPRSLEAAKLLLAALYECESMSVGFRSIQKEKNHDLFISSRC